MGQRYIVAEVSKNWVGREPYDPSTKLLSQSFEEIANHHAKKGYQLHSFRLHRLVIGDTELNETIIAVFELEDAT